jgi:superfamily II DNA or RNA helicase
MSNFDKMIGQLQTLHPDANDRGKAFEVICKWFLQKDPVYASQYTNVWLWDEWPGRWGPDIGIDLVAQLEDKSLVAIQAKCYADTVPIQEIDRFIAASARPEFSARLLIVTSTITKNTETTLQNQDKQSSFLLGYHLDESDVDWLAAIDASRPQRPTPHDPYPYQATAISDILKGFQSHDRGKAIMACGTGKTLVGLWVSQDLDATRTLVLVPSLSLIQQIAKEWHTNATVPFRSLFVCSDETVAKDAFVSHTGEIGLPVTTDATKIQEFLSGTGRRVVFSTYQSSLRIAEAQQAGAPAFDLVVADEAHHCTGKVESHFAAVLDGERIRSGKRLFMTATPRIATDRLRDEAKLHDLELASMDDEEQFGPDFHVLTFGEAIAGDLLSDYRVVIVGITEEDVKSRIDERQLLEWEASGFRTDAETMAALLGLVNVIDDYGLTHVITFHNRIKSAQQFSNDVGTLVDYFHAADATKQPLWAHHISSEMNTGERTTLLRQFRDLDDQVGILSNARCLNEGVDVRAIDGVAFIEPRQSNIDIVQAVGRAIRKSDTEKTGTIFIPVFLDPDEDADTALSSSRFGAIWGVLRALREHDEILADELDRLRYTLGRRGSIGTQWPGKIVIDMPEQVGSTFADALKTRLVEMSSASFEFWLGLLALFIEREGHARIKVSHKERGFKVGAWAHAQRNRHNAGTLSPERSGAMKALGFEWDIREANFQEGLSALRQFVGREGHARVNGKHKEGEFPLGQWVLHRRTEYNSKALTQEHFEALRELNFEWAPLEFAFQEGLSALRQFVKRFGHASVSTKQTIGEYNLGSWVSMQRKSHTAGNLPPDRFEALKALGFEWNSAEAGFQEGVSALRQFVEREGHARVKRNHKEDEFHLGAWVHHQRAAYQASRLSQARFEVLKDLGFGWDIHGGIYKEGLSALSKFVEREGHARVKNSHKEGEFNLGHWVVRQRSEFKAKRLPSERIEELRKLNFEWDPLEAAYQDGLSALRQFVKRFGHARVKQGHKEGEYNLGFWVSNMRRAYRNETLSPERMEDLRTLGFEGNILEANYQEGLSALSKFVEREGHADVPPEHKEDKFKLGQWMGVQKREYNAKRLTTKRFQALKNLGFMGVTHDNNRH